MIFHELKQLGRIYYYSKGPKYEPWGTPQFKSKGREITPCTETR